MGILVERYCQLLETNIAWFFNYGVKVVFMYKWGVTPWNNDLCKRFIAINENIKLLHKWFLCIILWLRRGERHWYPIHTSLEVDIYCLYKNPTPYPHKFKVNCYLRDFVKKYEGRKSGEHQKGVEIRVGGRIYNKQDFGEQACLLWHQIRGSESVSNVSGPGSQGRQPSLWTAAWAIAPRWYHWRSWILRPACAAKKESCRSLRLRLFCSRHVYINFRMSTMISRIRNRGTERDIWI